MAGIAVQVSVYPLRQAELGSVIDQALEIFRQHDLRVDPGAMSSVVVGEDEAVFAALKELYRQVAGQGMEVVIVATFSNACPVPPV